MANKNMIGATIYRLRREKGLSQSELGDIVGVTNKAVSKWETEEANPEISLLPKLAEALGVTIDELLGKMRAQDDVRSESVKPKTSWLGLEGSVVDDKDRFEFISDKKTKKGTPILHIHIGKRISTINAKARGVIAIGNNAKGLISIGLLSRGLLSIGVLSIGLLAFGVIGLGLLLAVGSIAFGGIALGAISIGIVSIGAISIGFVSIGAIAIGYFAHTSEQGIAIGKYITIHTNTKFK